MARDKAVRRSYGNRAFSARKSYGARAASVRAKMVQLLCNRRVVLGIRVPSVELHTSVEMAPKTKDGK